MQHTKQQTERLHEKLRRELGGKVLSALAEDDVIEVMLNPDGTLWTETRTGTKEQFETFTPSRGESVLSTVASLCEKVVNYENPLLNCVFPLDGSRFQGVLPPVSVAPAFSLRKHAKRVFPITEYVAQGILSKVHAQALIGAVETRKNILVAGGTSSGKTTLTNALLHECVLRGAPGERFLIIEDTYELQCSAPNTMSMHALSRAQLPILCQTAMRLRPDRVILGEVRGREAYDLMYLLNSGHPGSITTIHANSARLALHKLQMLACESGENVSPMRVVESIDLVVFIARIGTSRRVTEIVDVTGHDDSDYLTAPVTSEGYAIEGDVRDK